MCPKFSIACLQWSTKFIFSATVIQIHLLVQDMWLPEAKDKAAPSPTRLQKPVGLAAECYFKTGPPSYLRAAG